MMWYDEFKTNLNQIVKGLIEMILDYFSFESSEQTQMDIPVLRELAFSKIGEGQLREGLEALQPLYEHGRPSELGKDIILLSAWYEDNDQRFNKGIISSADFSFHYNLIQTQLFVLLSENTTQASVISEQIVSTADDPNDYNIDSEQLSTQTIEALIIEGEIEMAIRVLYMISKRNNTFKLENRHLVLKSNFKDIKRKESFGTIRDSDSTIELNKIRRSLLEICNEISPPMKDDYKRDAQVSFEEIERKIFDHEIDTAISMLREVAKYEKASEIAIDILFIQFNFKDITKKFNYGLIDYSDFSLGTSRIRNSLLEIYNKLKKAQGA